ncbi:ubiquitin-protein ligase Sel1 [Stagonosporopsis vannaccii]|nr:ubiquitin-protein ligase Sel1 [Stagonosporopsis vannaccii]
MVYDETKCVEFINGTIECSRESGFWYTQKGQIIKWSILGAMFALFMAWFIGGYIHAKRRLKAGKPLLAYHRFLVSWQERKRYGQTPQNHFTFYATQNPYANRPPYTQRADGSWPEPPPTYNGADAPPQYFAPPGATKASPSQGMEMGQFGTQQSGVVGGNGGGGGGDVEQGGQGQALPPRPPIKAKAVLKGFTDRFRK